MLDAGPELLGALIEPAAVGTARATGDQVQQPGMELTCIIAGEVDHRGDVATGPEPAWAPHVLVHPERDFALQAGRLARAPLSFNPHR